MSMTKFQIFVTGLLLGTAAILSICQHRSQIALRSQNECLRQRLSQMGAENQNLSNSLWRVGNKPTLQFPAVSTRSVNAADPAEGLAVTQLITRMVHGEEAPLLSTAQIEGYLGENHRSVASLLSAYRTSKDPAFLQEAMEKYPGDARAAFEAVLEKDASPTQRREWLEAFKRAAPENSLAEYLSALDYFRSGQTGQALQELLTASGRQGFADYTVERIQNDEEAYRAAGYSEGDAKMAATWGVPLPQLSEMRALARNIVDLASSYRNAGDQNSAQTVLQMAIGLGNQLDASTGTCVPLVTRLVGIGIQRMALESMDPSSPYGDGTIQDQLDGLAQRRDSIKDLVQQSVPFQTQMTSQDWFTYNERTLSFGEENAIVWLLNKYNH